MTNDIVKIVYDRMTTVDGEFAAERERGHLRELLTHSYARSIYGSSASKMSISSHSGSCAASKRADAEAQLAAK